MRLKAVLILVGALILAPIAAQAAPATFVTNLTQAIEVPPTGSPGTGSATIVLDPAANTLSLQITFSGLQSATIMAHIHCCLPAALATGVNVTVATVLPAFPGFPLGVTSGTYSGSLDLTQASSYNPAFITAHGGTVAGAAAALIAGIQSQQTYLNIHTTNLPSGEIRGFLVPAPSPTPGRLSLIKTIPINGTAANRSNQMFSFDISYLDAANGLYYLADRSNAALDVVDTTGAFTGTPDTLFGQIGGAAFGFQGDTGTTSTSGPNGVVAAFPCIFATDGNSRVVSVNANVSYTTPASSINTGGQFRADEIAYDPKDGIVLAINNADTPPFGTLITVNKSTCALSNPIKVNISAANGVNATNGAEQPAWDPTTQRFYVSIPEINGPGDGTGPNGGVVRVNPTTGVLENLYQINFCQPAGLTVGPNGDLLVGCNSVFDFSGKKCSAITVAANSSAATPATCSGVANPQSAVCNPGRGCTGNALVAVPGVGGGDEVWFNSGDGNYYVTASNNPIGPSLGVIGSAIKTPPNSLNQVLPTLPPINAVTTGSPKHGSGTVHSVAASPVSNHVYVPLPANTNYPNCAQGCIAVYGSQ